MIARKRKIKPVIKSLLIGAGEMIHWLTAMVTLPEDLCSVPRTTRWFIIIHKIQFQENPCHFLIFRATRDILGTYT